MTVVTRMVSPWSAKAHNIMTDNFFMSVGLVEKLIAQNVSIVGTSQETTKATSHQKNGGHNRKSVSHVQKNRCVLLLSTMHHSRNVSLEEDNKLSTKSVIDKLERPCSYKR
ncbi:hypothetical protein T08_7367 [Trichinella sp. T8]|nr:hypothetical protein T08_7367 [Trichinella sp. T8]